MPAAPSRLACWLLVVAVAAGCLRPDAPSAPSVDGEAALQWVEDIVYAGDDLRPRYPEHPEHDATAQWLAQAATVEGWHVRTVAFTGQDYMDLDKPSSIRPYADACSQEDQEALPSLTFTNIVATLEGGEGHAMIGAHWDAKEDADSGPAPVPAANDGASGVGLMLQLQRHIRDHNLTFPYDLTFVFFDGEDGFEDCHPLAGSVHYAATQELPDRFILLDMVGDRDARFPREGRSVRSDPALVDLIWSKAPDHGLAENFVEQEKSVLDDHVPFIEAGVPSVDIIDYARPSDEGRFGFPPYWHTHDDTPDKLDADMRGRMGDLLLDVLQDPAFRQWP